MKHVYTAESLIDGQLVVDWLAQCGVLSLLLNQNAMSGFGDLPMTYPEVWVKHDSDLEKARLSIARFKNSPLSAADKTCATCQEPNPASFDICWQCNTPLR